MALSSRLLNDFADNNLRAPSSARIDPDQAWKSPGLNDDKDTVQHYRTIFRVYALYMKRPAGCI
ncbi:hypothetical protein HGO34_23585 [Agrobacterium vitis]|uniref:Uncharacterized protein n=1 Tax=Agrobacterium vitis TaxID=373 RepID=A0AAE5AY54_AGRVI|nr:hypothetical protein [Agrobacterium vitis]MCF1500393.1 hypothetical protein [Allorhizobium sp. Av2]MCM2442687.1 hypothetical protein [Agrobacterium vitis]MUZ60354.1 hypothetical protein [Agrobacterium vitis]MVA68409.1 hypothetical protein [Agrobacterium vitis]MVA88839.1 hypothetical protein [Agrobacterium vitis]